MGGEDFAGQAGFIHEQSKCVCADKARPRVDAEGPLQALCTFATRHVRQGALSASEKQPSQFYALLRRTSRE